MIGSCKNSKYTIKSNDADLWVRGKKEKVSKRGEWKPL